MNIKHRRQRSAILRRVLDQSQIAQGLPLTLAEVPPPGKSLFLLPIRRKRRAGGYTAGVIHHVLLTSRELGRVYRYIDTDNYWRAYARADTALIYLVKRVAGVETTVATASWTPATDGELRAIWQGNRHRVWIDQRLVIDYEDAALYLASATKVGLWSRNAAAVGTLDDEYGQAI